MNILPLRFAKVWVALGWVFVALAIVVCLLPGGTPGLAVTNDKVEHASAYALLTLWFTGIYPRSRYWFVALALASMGAVIEVLQGWMASGREADLLDEVANVSGIVIGLSLATLFLGGWMQRVEKVLIRW